jgi:leucyl-tRNA synthetase
MAKYNPKKIESKWTKYWIEKKTFVPDLEKSKNPYHALFMFPYPSAEGLHIGNFYAFISVDVMAKYKRLKGFDVYEPIGWDAFGIHSENYALKIGETPEKMLHRTIKNFRHQLQAAGLSCDWTREVNTTDPEYYKWTQWIFTKLFEKGLAYQKEALVNWCPDCKTVLADEQIEAEGLCERCKTTVEKRKMKQWFFEITEYAERLLTGLEKMDWSEITKSAQRNWIGKSEGARIVFKFLRSDLKNYNIEVFTTRVDTLFGCTYVVLSPEHELVLKIATSEKKKEVEKYVKKASRKSEMERKESKEKTGVFTGAYALNPVNNEKVPIWVADYVLAGYGTGAVMAVPAHDERDFEFAKKYKLPIKAVIFPEIIKEERSSTIPLKGGEELQLEKDSVLEIADIKKGRKFFTSDGILFDSEKYTRLKSEKAREEITKWLKENKLGRKETNFRLRDWCISRQRYWGPPIPVVYCEKCGTVAVPEKDLPVKLPELKKGWEPAGDGKGPLAKVESFMKTTCPKCGGEARREPDVMDNFLDSAWYFFRYVSPKDKKEIFDKKMGKKWLPVDLYVGGNEHAVLHLMYTRFITMALHDLGLTDFENPFKKFRANGMILKDGKKMSKSKGNVVNPEEYGEKLGYDALKSYLLFLGPLSEDRSFSDEGIRGLRHWAERVFNLKERASKKGKDSEAVVKKLHQTIKAVEDDMENQKYNTAIAKLMELTNVFYGAEKISENSFEKYIVIVSIFLPALAEELWHERGHKKSIFLEKWPEYDPKLVVEKEANIVIQVNGKVRDQITIPADAEENDIKKLAFSSEKIKKYIPNTDNIRKIIFVPGRLINFVV